MGVRRVVLVTLAVFLLFGVSTASAHVPKTASGNESLESAMIIEDPIKSWAIYSELKGGDVANYYEMEMESGERLYLSLLTPKNEDFVPNLAVIGPGIDGNDTTPDFVQIPDDVGIKVIEGDLGERKYEPFTPGSYYHPATFDQNIEESGTYHAVVYSEEGAGGNYGLAVGYEERWSLVEWILLPLDVINIRIWEGQSLWLIFAPMIAVLTLGFTWTGWKYRSQGKRPGNVREWFLLTSGLLYIGSGAMMLMQIVIALSGSSPSLTVIVTLIFALIPVILGYKLFEESSDFKKPEVSDRIRVFVFGILGLTVWAGIILGPVLAMIPGLLLSREG